MAETLIEVENLSVKFPRDLKRTLSYAFQDLAFELTGSANGHRELRAGEFWALRGITFNVNRGECLGILGPNGSGKSTLLRVLSGLIKPDQGRAVIRGRVSSILRLGAGFNPVLTGRENIFLYGSFLGISNREMNKKLDRIIEFCELGPSIDTPLMHYSTGMTGRLGFAVASQVDPDVLLIDEAIRVGDAGFRDKCVDLIHRLAPRVAILFVSHSASIIAQVCTHLFPMGDYEPLLKAKDFQNCFKAAIPNLEFQKKVALVPEAPKPKKLGLIGALENTSQTE